MHFSRGSTFNLPWGSEVYAKISAVNVYGESELSEEGNGAVIITSPDAPINLELDETKRGATQIGLKWTEALSNGGSPVLDYSLYMDEANTGNFILQKSAIQLT